MLPTARRHRLGILLLLCAVIGGVFACSTPLPATQTQKPNIVFLFTDDLNLDEISVMPHLKSLLIDQGVSFSNYFVSVSLCCPSRTTTLRGEYSHNTDVLSNGGSNGGFQTAHEKGIENSTIATWLQAAGYRTGLFGKYLNGYPTGVSDTYIPPGWDDWHSAAKGDPYSEFNYTLNDNGKLDKYGNQPQDYGTDVYVNDAVNFITTSAQMHKPSFTYLAVYAPHQPATPAPADANLFPNAQAPRTPSYNEGDVSDKPNYIKNAPLMTPAVETQVDALYRKRLQSLQDVDRSIGKLIDTLTKTNQLQNTYFFFTSDNGFHLGQHRLPAGKQTAYEEDIHLPLIVRGPGIPAGKTVTQMTGNTDLAPTFAALGGAQTPSFVDGRSFVPLLHGTAPATWRQVYLVEHWNQGGQAKVSTADNTTLEPNDLDQMGFGQAGKLGGPAIPEFHGLRTQRYTYIEYTTGERELYDLQADPNELQNIITTTDPALVQQLSQRLAALKTCSGTSCRTDEDMSLTP